MALSDLNQELSKPDESEIDSAIEELIVTEALELVTDVNGDVKNMMIQVCVSLFAERLLMLHRTYNHTFAAWDPS